MCKIVCMDQKQPYKSVDMSTVYEKEPYEKNICFFKKYTLFQKTYILFQKTYIFLKKHTYFFKNIYTFFKNIYTFSKNICFVKRINLRKSIYFS